RRGCQQRSRQDESGARGTEAPSRRGCQQRSRQDEERPNGAAESEKHLGFFRIAQAGHLALSRSARAASRACATICAWSNAVNLPARRRTRPSTITVSTFAGAPNDTSAS